MSYRSSTGLFGFNSASNRRALSSINNKEDIADRPPEEIPSARRRRHTSSLISDHSDGLPYVSRGSSIDNYPSSKSPTPEPTRERAKMSNPRAFSASVASMRPMFDISGPAASESPGASSAKRSTKRKKAVESTSDDLSDANADGGRATSAIAEGDADGVDTFYKTYRQLLKSHQGQTDHFENLHNDHAKALKKIQNLASRRKQRIEQLERENAALRRTVTAGSTATTEHILSAEELSASERTIEMLTKDLTTWENKYNTSQHALRAISDDAATFERKYNNAQSSATALSGQVEQLKREIEGAKDGIKNGTRQLKGLQRILRKVDRTIVERVRELARLSAEWDNRGGADERLRTKVSEEMGELVAAWRRFEGEYDEGVVADGGGPED